MTKQYRQKSQVVQHLLEILSNGEMGIRDITLKINLSHIILSNYLKILVVKELVSINIIIDKRGQKREKYYTTDKGFQFLKILRGFNETFNWINLI